MHIAPERKLFTVLLGILAGLPALSIDISSPTLVELPAALATTTFVAGLTLSLFMLGFALGLMLGGRISDRIGRRPVLLSALSTFIVSGIACALSQSGLLLVAARFLQGAGAGGCSVLAYAMVQDLFEGEAARSKRSYITVILGVVPVLAPALGAGLSALAGWRSVYVILIVAGALLFIFSASALDESLRRRTPEPGAVYVRLRDDRRFVRIALINGLSYGSLFAYIAGVPVVTMGQLGLSATIYAGLFACTALSLSAGAWTSVRLGRFGFGASQMAWPALAAQAAATVAIALAGELSVHKALLLTPMLLACFFARGIAAPNLIHLAMAGRTNDAGLASATIGVVQLVCASFGSAVVAALLPHFQAPAVSVPMALMAGTAAILWLTLGARSNLAPTRL